MYWVSPILLLLPITYNGDGMVQFSCTTWPVVDSSLVVVEVTAMWRDGNCHRLVCHSVHQRHLAIALDFPEANDLCRRFTVPQAPTSDGLVFVGRCAGDPSILFDPLESSGHQATFATIIKVVAIYQLLLRQRHQSPSLDLVYSFNCSDGGECPARSCSSIPILNLIIMLSAHIKVFRTSVYREIHINQLRFWYCLLLC